MMILRKGKHSFWSQLLLSVIAIFALPDAQGLSHQANLPNENYQNAQSVQQQFFRAVSLVKQVQKQQFIHIDAVPEISPILVKIEPHFYVEHFHIIPPIRAGPTAI
ncbi:secA translation cis-regulator SecM [Bisgaard Taxon 46]